MYTASSDVVCEENRESAAGNGPGADRSIRSGPVGSDPLKKMTDTQDLFRLKVLQVEATRPIKLTLPLMFYVIVNR
jgi:hypothetical protein